MSNENAGGAPKKLSTKEILALARAKAAGGAPPSEPAAAAPEPAAEEAPVAAPEAVAAEAAPAAPKPSPAKGGSTKDILAAARAAAAAKAGGAPAPDAPKAAAPKPAAAKPAGDKPKSTAEILAAARGKAAPGAAAAAPAKEKPAAAPGAKPAVAAGGPKPSVQEMLAAVREKGAGIAASPAAEAKAAAPKAVAPPIPTKPIPAAKPGKGANVERRTFVLATLFSSFSLAWIAFTGAVGAMTLGTLRFMLPNVLTEPPSKFKVGPPADFDLGTVSEKFKASNGIWLVHTDKYQGKNLIYALSTVCTHLGCTPSWLDGEQKYKCPCHGSGFYISGINFEGPAPRPLERVGIRLAEDGMLEVDKSLKFQEEMGQWADPASYVEIT